MPNDSITTKPADAASVRAKIRARLEYPRGAVDHSKPEPQYLKPPVSSLTNLEIILGQDPAFFAFLGHNTFTDEVTWNDERVTDEMETTINMQIQSGYKLNMSTERVREVMMVVAKQHPYHPVQDWLKGLTWDGVPRVDTLLTAYASVDDTPLHRAIARKWMLSAVARVMQPGCQVDTMLILVGIQGAQKSSFFRALCHSPEWFSDTALDIGDKDAFMALAGVWIYEIGELSALQGREAEPVKAFLTSRTDRFRPPYGRNMIHRPRQGVFVGSTNASEFLDDPTGSRRFWPVRAGKIDIEAVKRDHVQLWAEAMELYQKNTERWWFTAEEESELVTVRNEYQRVDSWQDAISDWLEHQMGSVTVRDVLAGALNLDLRDHTKAAVMRAAALIAACGWKKRRVMIGSVQSWRWERA
jgi:putative DNA primase/helicase